MVEATPSNGLIGDNFLAWLQDQDQQEIYKTSRETSSAMTAVIMGNSGVGKSTSVNHLIEPLYSNISHPGAKVGSEEEGSITKECTTYQGYLHDQRLDIIDTPGFGDCHGLKDEQILVNTLDYVANKSQTKNIDVFFLVEDTKGSRVYLEKNLQTLKTIFGKEAAAKTVIILTKNIDSLVGGNKQKKRLKERVAKISKIAEENGVECPPVPWFINTDDEDEIEVICSEQGLREEQINLLQPLQRQTLSSIVKSRRSKPLPFLTMQMALYRAVLSTVQQRLATVNRQATLLGVPANKVYHPARTEQYYDPNVGSMAGSICSFGISAACGANMSTRHIAAWTEYKPVSARVSRQFDGGICKDITYEFNGDCKSAEVRKNLKDGTFECLLTTTGAITASVDIKVRSENYDIVKEEEQKKQANQLVKDSISRDEDGTTVYLNPIQMLHACNAKEPGLKAKLVQMGLQQGFGI